MDARPRARSRARARRARRAQWRSVADAPPLWRAACLAVAQWRSGPGDAAVPSLEMHAERFYDARWRQMYELRPRLRTDGIYVSRCAAARARAACVRAVAQWRCALALTHPTARAARSNTYLRRGTIELRSRVPIHVVCYFRYYAFTPSGTFLYRTTPSPPCTQRVLARPRAALRQPGVLSGELRCAEERVHTVMACASGRLSFLHTWLRLRSTCRGAHNRLDVRSMVSVDDGAPEPAEPPRDHDAYSAPDGLSWHATEAGGLGGWNDGAVRTLARGLTPYVFVPWEELDSTELNKSAEEMDYFVPG